MKEYWDRHGENHWLDATAMACAGASMLGMRIVGEAAIAKVAYGRTLQQMAAAAKS